MLRCAAVLIALCILCGCNQQEMLQRFTSPEEQATARHYIDLLREHRYQDIEQAMDASITGPKAHEALIQMGALMPVGEPTSVTLVGAHRYTANDVSTANLAFEYNFSGRWLLASVAVKTEGRRASMVGFHVNTETASLAQQTRFTLVGKSLVQYAILALAVLLPLFTLYVLILCIRSPLKGRKWPWVLFVLVGVCKVGVNWTTGQWGWMPLAVQLFSASARAPLYGPWTLAVSIPLGAVVFLMQRRALVASVGSLAGASDGGASAGAPGQSGSHNS